MISCEYADGVSHRLAHGLVPTSAFDGTGTIEFDVIGTSLTLRVINVGNPPLQVASAQDSLLASPGSVGIRGKAGTQFNEFGASG
jgi:hypothetical protein